MVGLKISIQHTWLMEAETHNSHIAFVRFCIKIINIGLNRCKSENMTVNMVPFYFFQHQENCSIDVIVLSD